MALHGLELSSHHSSGRHYSALKSSIRAPRFHVAIPSSHLPQIDKLLAARRLDPQRRAYLSKTHRTRAYHALKTYTPRTTYGMSPKKVSRKGVRDKYG
jgi:hypothetical protein